MARGARTGLLDGVSRRGSKSGGGLMQASMSSRQRPFAWAVTALAGGLLLGFTLGLQLGHVFTPRLRSTLQQDRLASAKPIASHSAAGVLVLYSFFDGDEVSWGNLLFFLRHAIDAGDGGQYIVLLNGFTTLEDNRLPALPPNAKYLLHRNECYDWGTYEWALRTHVEKDDYEYFIFINSSVRGPILPWYADKQQSWTKLFTGKLSDKVKLVGPAISCEHFCVTLEGRQQCRKNAHVQSVAVATDQEGLRVLQAAGYVLRCHDNRASAVFFGEIGASLAILEAGYTIDSFLTRYQGVDWRDTANWQCNKAVSPIGKRTFDGVTVPAHELVFPKVKGSLLESGVPSHYDAWKLSQWMSLPAEDRNVTANWFQEEGGLQARIEDIVIAQAKGIDCFDWDFYKIKNPDVAGLPRAAQWSHFLRRGAVEFREHRWLCGLNVEAVMAGESL